MVAFGKSGCIRVKVFVIGQELYSVKVAVFGQKWFYSDRSGYIGEIVAVIWQKWLYSAKVVVFG